MPWKLLIISVLAITGSTSRFVKPRGSPWYKVHVTAEPLSKVAGLTVLTKTVADSGNSVPVLKYEGTEPFYLLAPKDELGFDVVRMRVWLERINKFVKASGFKVLADPQVDQASLITELDRKIGAEIYSKYENGLGQHYEVDSFGSPWSPEAKPVSSEEERFWTWGATIPEEDGRPANVKVPKDFGEIAAVGVHRGRIVLIRRVLSYSLNEKYEEGKAARESRELDLRRLNERRDFLLRIPFLLPGIFLGLWMFVSIRRELITRIKRKLLRAIIGALVLNFSVLPFAFVAAMIDIFLDSRLGMPAANLYAAGIIVSFSWLFFVAEQIECGIRGIDPPAEFLGTGRRYVILLTVFLIVFGALVTNFGDISGD